MSHFTNVQTQVHDPVLLEETLRQLAYEFEMGENLTIRGYQNSSTTGDVVIRPGGRYDIGMQLQADNTYALCADWWGVQRSCGVSKEDFVNNLHRTYAHLAVKRQAVEQGLIIEEEKILANGDIELILSEPF